MKRGVSDNIEKISSEHLKKINSLKDSKGVSFAHIGRKMGFTRSQMSMIKAGKRFLSLSERKKLDEVLREFEV